MKYIYFFMKMVVRDRAMQITDIVNIESLALRLLALALESLALLTSLIITTSMVSFLILYSLQALIQLGTVVVF